jgi:hypothetical protein
VGFSCFDEHRTDTAKPARCENRSGPLARRLTGSRVNPSADPLAVLCAVLAAARRAAYSFEEAWAIGAEAALSYMTTRQAQEWWAALDPTECSWADAYARRGSRLGAVCSTDT